MITPNPQERTSVGPRLQGRSPRVQAKAQQAPRERAKEARSFAWSECHSGKSSVSTARVARQEEPQQQGDVWGCPAMSSRKVMNPLGKTPTE
eukprot:2540079-Amphidinium_carterae.1